MVQAFRCFRCGHTWFPRGFDDNGKPIPPPRCAKCRSPYWDHPPLSSDERGDTIKAGLRAKKKAGAK